jgi:hypothetical protein
LILGISPPKPAGTARTGSVRISPSPRDCRHYYSDQEHDHQEQRDFPTPSDRRDCRNGYAKCDYANSNQRIITPLDASLFPEPEKHALARVRWRSVVSQCACPFYAAFSETRSQMAKWSHPTD